MTDAQSAYFESQVLTAPPERLRLLVIDGALRFARLTLQYWEQALWNEAFESLIRCRGCVSELLAGVQPDGSALSNQVAAVYLSLFRTLTELQVYRDRVQMERVIETLETERETWLQVCELRAAAGDDPLHAAAAADFAAEPIPAPLDLDPLPEGGFSFDA